MMALVDKHLSATTNVALPSAVSLHRVIPARPGVVVIGRLLDDSPFVFEDTTGREVSAWRGDVIAGVIGARRALRGVTGSVPHAIAANDILHVLNRGGVVGLADDSTQAPRLQLLGAVDDGTGAALTIETGTIAPSDTLTALPPVVAIAGSCMNAGKTAAACALVRAFRGAGYRVGVAKLTGVAATKDVLAMLDCGAETSVTFVDAGLPSTCSGGDVVRAARGCFNALATHGVDIIVAELGDGLLGDYGVDSILAAADVRQAIDAIVLSAADPVAAWGGVALLGQVGLATTVVTGPTTDNIAGCDAVTRATDVPAHNARTGAAMLAHHVFKAFNSRPSAAVTATADASRCAAKPIRRSLPVAALAAVVMGGA